MLQSLFYRKLIHLKTFAFEDEEFRLKHPRLEKLVGAIIYQAMHDGMSKVQIGVDRATFNPFMKYFGPATGEPSWWDMVPPPAESYPAIVQLCLVAAKLRPGLPIQGEIPATNGKKRLNLHFEMAELYSFEISWETFQVAVRLPKS